MFIQVIKKTKKKTQKVTGKNQKKHFLSSFYNLPDTADYEVSNDDKNVRSRMILSYFLQLKIIANNRTMCSDFSSNISS